MMLMTEGAWPQSQPRRDKDKRHKVRQSESAKSKADFYLLAKMSFVSPFYLGIFAFEFQTGFEFVHTGKSISLYKTESKNYLGG